MNALFLAAAAPAVSVLMSWLVWAAIAAVLIWAVVALLKYLQVPIAQPVYIILGAFVSIGLILLIAKAFNLLM